jgi:hypothetical protein
MLFAISDRYGLRVERGPWRSAMRLGVGEHGAALPVLARRTMARCYSLTSGYRKRLRRQENPYPAERYFESRRAILFIATPLPLCRAAGESGCPAHQVPIAHGAQASLR